MTNANALDVARYQDGPRGPLIEWNTLHAAHPELFGVFYKLSQGPGFLDPEANYNRRSIGWARFRIAYHFLDLSGTMRDQAIWFLKCLGTLEDGEGVMLDAEDNRLTPAMCDEWADRVEQVTQRPISGYTGAYVSGGTLWDSPVFYSKGRARMFAAYTDEAHARSIAAPQRWDGWQFTSTGSLPGISGRVDLDRLDNLAAFDAICHATPKTPPPPFDPKRGLFGLWPIGPIPRPLAPGARGDAVSYAQGVILWRAGGAITVDGIYGPETSRRVADLQRTFHITGEMGVGPRTWGALNYLALTTGGR